MRRELEKNWAKMQDDIRYRSTILRGYVSEQTILPARARTAGLSCRPSHEAQSGAGAASSNSRASIWRRVTRAEAEHRKTDLIIDMGKNDMAPTPNKVRSASFAVGQGDP
jgi:hypothetical protein